jgi:hypothetical protein
VRPVSDQLPDVWLKHSGQRSRAVNSRWSRCREGNRERITQVEGRSEERRRLEAAIAQLSADALRELIALIWLVQRPSLTFEAALRRTRRIPPAAQPGYLMGIRLERYIAEGLRKLGCGGADDR